jgi:hypothetical protein
VIADDYIRVLEHEFSADDGSFLIQMRCDLTWDKATFTRLTEAMLACCKAYDARDERPTLMGSAYDKTQVPRWLADGFWYLSFYVKDWTTHPNWERTTAPEQEYYDRAYVRLFDLATWFFTGHSPYTDPNKGFASM